MFVLAFASSGIAHQLHLTATLATKVTGVLYLNRPVVSSLDGISAAVADPGTLADGQVSLWTLDCAGATLPGVTLGVAPSLPAVATLYYVQYDNSLSTTPPTTIRGFAIILDLPDGTYTVTSTLGAPGTLWPVTFDQDATRITEIVILP